MKLKKPWHGRVSPDGPGTRLHQALKAWGFKEQDGCQCFEYAVKMNVNGPQWVKDNIATVLNWLRKSAKQRKLPFSRWIAKRFILGAVADYERGNMNLRDIFKRVHCVNLNRRKDRWQRFIDGLPEDWPFAPVRRVKAIDGKKVPSPKGWKGGGGAWGCYRSHLRLIEQALNDGVDSILLMEDDAVFCEDFTTRVKAFFEAVPDDWGMIYLGGQHQFINEGQPRKINPLVFQPFNVNRTHCFGLRGQTMRAVYKHLIQAHDNWGVPNHIDHWLGRFHEQRSFPVYCPHEWLVGQREGKSNIAGRRKEQNFWIGAKSLPPDKDPNQYPFIAVVGIHSSGSSMVAGMVHHLGIFLGNEFVKGPWKKTGSFEAVGLASIAEWAIPFGSTELAVKKGQLWARLKGWINQKRREALEMRTTAGGKYPQLCRMSPQLLNIVGDNLWVINVERPIEESIASLKRRFAGKDLEKINRHQRWLYEGKLELLSKVPPERQFTVDYHDTLKDPKTTVEGLVEFLGLNPGEERKENAVALVNPEQCHFRKGTS